MKSVLNAQWVKMCHLSRLISTHLVGMVWGGVGWMRSLKTLLSQQQQQQQQTLACIFSTALKSSRQLARLIAGGSSMNVYSQVPLCPASSSSYSTGLI